MKKTFNKIYWGIQKHPVYLGLIVSAILILFGAIVNNYLKPPINKGGKPEETSAKSDFDLQEKCAKASKDYFKEEGYTEEGLNNFNNHYNKKMNKCYMVTYTFQCVAKDQCNNGEELIDVFEHKTVANFIKDGGKQTGYCYYPNGNVTTECYAGDFDLFVKPYMEE